MSFAERAIQRVEKLMEQCEEGSEEYIDYVVMKQALEKQVSKKIKTTGKGYLYCSACLKNVRSTDKHCNECGQKLEAEHE